MIYDNIIRITMFKVSAEQKRTNFKNNDINIILQIFPIQSLEYQSLNQTLLSYPFLHNTSKKMFFCFYYALALLRVYGTRIMIESLMA